jgi:hypothetical protein
MLLDIDHIDRSEIVAQRAPSRERDDVNVVPAIAKLARQRENEPLLPANVQRQNHVHDAH